MPSTPAHMSQAIFWTSLILQDTTAWYLPDSLKMLSRELNILKKGIVKISESTIEERAASF